MYNNTSTDGTLHAKGTWKTTDKRQKEDLKFLASCWDYSADGSKRPGVGGIHAERRTY